MIGKRVIANSNDGRDMVPRAFSSEDSAHRNSHCPKDRHAEYHTNNRQFAQDFRCHPYSLGYAFVTEVDIDADGGVDETIESTWDELANL